ncbi:MAG: hypothetical protein K2R98_27980 [Gemmataceae bacterium]|nr:hypothetical protein [Gemmataceae bacterium]
MVFATIVALTLLSAGISVYLTTHREPTEQDKLLLGVMTDTWKMGFGAILGLIGGKALA